MARPGLSPVIRRPQGDDRLLQCGEIADHRHPRQALFDRRQHAGPDPRSRRARKPRFARPADRPRHGAFSRAGPRSDRVMHNPVRGRDPSQRKRHGGRRRRRSGCLQRDWGAQRDRNRPAHGGEPVRRDKVAGSLRGAGTRAARILLRVSPPAGARPARPGRLRPPRPLRPACASPRAAHTRSSFVTTSLRRCGQWETVTSAVTSPASWRGSRAMRESGDHRQWKRKMPSR